MARKQEVAASMQSVQCRRREAADRSDDGRASGCRPTPVARGLPGLDHRRRHQKSPDCGRVLLLLDLNPRPFEGAQTVRGVSHYMTGTWQMRGLNQNITLAHY